MTLKCVLKEENRKVDFLCHWA